MNRLPMFEKCEDDGLKNTILLIELLISLCNN